MRKRGIIKITLKSDLCVGSGYSYAGIIDSDVCYDTCGIPYIPAKRLKGCLRDSAENILYAILTEDDVKCIFGESGAQGTNGIILDNAYVREYDGLRAEIDTVLKKYPKLISVQDVLEQFTHVKAQTKLVNGVTDDSSLRFSRVVNQYAPDKTEMVFEAVVSFEDDVASTVENTLKKIVNATRNIGLMRNRGIGSVVCQLCDVTEVDFETEKVEIEAEEDYVITYVFRNDEPLMLSSKGDSRSEKYITGQKVLGLLAKKYLEVEGHTADSTEFQDLFLNGKTMYAHAYPYKKKKRFYPVPDYINRLKKTKVLVNTYCKYDEMVHGEDYNPNTGNQPKKLKGKFIASNKKDMMVTDVDMSIIYHHSHSGESRGGDEGILYSMEAVQERQMFAGMIYVSSKYVQTVMDLLQTGELRFGKSITAQYGKCVLTDTPKYRQMKNAYLEVNAGQKIVVNFVSDAIFVDETSVEYTVYGEQVEKIVAKQLGIADKIETCKESAMLRTKLQYGYQTTWNLRKEPIPVIEAGGCLVYQLKEDAVIPYGFVGEKNIEGFGEIKVELLGEDYNLTEKKLGVSINELNKIENKMAEKIIENICIKSILDTLRLHAMDTNAIQISKATLGRVTMMLQESLGMHKKSPSNAFTEFVKRVQSIKTTSVREEVEKKLLKKIAIRKEKEENGKLIVTWQLKELPGYDKSMEQLSMLALIGWDANKCKQEVDKKWGDFLLLTLVHQKYIKSKEEKNSNGK